LLHETGQSQDAQPLTDAHQQDSRLSQEKPIAEQDQSNSEFLSAQPVQDQASSELTDMRVAEKNCQSVLASIWTTRAKPTHFSELGRGAARALEL
jgi:hypothetical protein